MTQKILITGAQSALAYQLAWHLKNNEIVLADSDNYVNLIPQASSNSFAHQFLNYCLNQQINIVFAIKADEQQALNQSKILFAEFGIDLIMPNLHDLLTVKKSDFFDEDIINLKSFNDFESFSAGVLKAGYPKNVVCFSKADGLGTIYQINDDEAKSFFITTNSNTLSFTQVSKFLNQKVFVPLYIYPTKKKITVCQVLLYSNQVFTYQNISPSQLQVIKNIQKIHNINGFLQVAFADDKLLYLNNVQL